MKTRLSLEQGTITLMVVITLVLIAALTSFYSTQSVFIDRLAGNAQVQTTQARLAAEAALAWAQAEIQRLSQTASAHSFWTTTVATSCPASHIGPHWQCVRMQPPPLPGSESTSAEVVAIRDVVNSPHVTELLARSTLADGHGRAQVGQSLYSPTVSPPPQTIHAAALLLNGCSQPAAGAQPAVCPLSASGQACQDTATGPAMESLWLADTDQNGQVSAAEHQSCLAWGAAHLPGGGAVLGPSIALPRLPCHLAVWQKVLGDITTEQVQAWSQAQERQGLNSQSQPPRTVYWVDSPLPWSHSVGTPQAPVLMVFSEAACTPRCPSMANGVHIHGTVVLDTQCQDDKARGWRAGLIEGQLVINSGWPDAPSDSRVWARPYAHMAYQLTWPSGIDARQVQRINGSWHEGWR